MICLYGLFCAVYFTGGMKEFKIFEIKQQIAQHESTCEFLLGGLIKIKVNILLHFFLNSASEDSLKNKNNYIICTPN